MSNRWQRQTRIDFWVTLGFCVTSVVLLVLMWVAAFMVAVASAKAHSWYDPWCCNNSDCQPVSAEEVQTLPDGYHVRGFVIPYSEARVSADRDYHFCEYPKGTARCFYAPATGS